MRLIPTGIFPMRLASRDGWFFPNCYVLKRTSAAQQPRISDAFGVRLSKLPPEQLARCEHLIVACLRSVFRQTPLLLGQDKKFFRRAHQNNLMNTHHKKQTALADQKDIESNQDFMKPLESISLPVGTFAGIEDRIIRVRNGKRVPADTGDQGGGQN
jgi:hypothetical protein